MTREIIDTLFRQSGETLGDWPEFQRRCHRVIAGAVIRTGGSQISSDLADDLIQDVYVRLCSNDYRALRELRGRLPDALFGLFTSVAVSVTLDHFRHANAQKRDTRKVVALGECPEPANDPAEALEKSLFLQQVDRALPGLSSDGQAQRDSQIFWLHYRQSLTAREIATVPGIGLTAKGVESALKRMMDGLRGIFAPAEGKPGANSSPERNPDQSAK